MGLLHNDLPKDFIKTELIGQGENTAAFYKTQNTVTIVTSEWFKFKLINELFPELLRTDARNFSENGKEFFSFSMIRLERHFSDLKLIAYLQDINDYLIDNYGEEFTFDDASWIIDCIEFLDCPVELTKYKKAMIKYYQTIGEICYGFEYRVDLHIGQFMFNKDQLVFVDGIFLENPRNFHQKLKDIEELFTSKPNLESMFGITLNKEDQDRLLMLFSTTYSLNGLSSYLNDYISSTVEINEVKKVINSLILYSDYRAHWACPYLDTIDEFEIFDLDQVIIEILREIATRQRESLTIR